MSCLSSAFHSTLFHLCVLFYTRRNYSSILSPNSCGKTHTREQQRAHMTGVFQYTTVAYVSTILGVLALQYSSVVCACTVPDGIMILGCGLCFHNARRNNTLLWPLVLSYPGDIAVLGCSLCFHNAWIHSRLWLLLPPFQTALQYSAVACASSMLVDITSPKYTVYGSVTDTRPRPTHSRLTLFDSHLQANLSMCVFTSLTMSQLTSAP